MGRGSTSTYICVLYSTTYALQHYYTEDELLKSVSELVTGFWGMERLTQNIKENPRTTQITIIQNNLGMLPLPQVYTFDAMRDSNQVWD